jgi:hypothetical protein
MVEELVAPYYCVKLAKSGRSKCTQMGKKLENCADCSASWNKEDPSSTLMGYNSSSRIHYKGRTLDWSRIAGPVLPMEDGNTCGVGAFHK